MNYSELARTLSRVATDAVLDLLPETNSREWELDQAIRHALAKHLAQQHAITQSHTRAEREAKARRQRQRQTNKQGGKR